MSLFRQGREIGIADTGLSHCPGQVAHQSIQRISARSYLDGSRLTQDGYTCARRTIQAQLRRPQATTRSLNMIQVTRTARPTKTRTPGSRQDPIQQLIHGTSSRPDYMEATPSAPTSSYRTSRSRRGSTRLRAPGWLRLARQEGCLHLCIILSLGSQRTIYGPDVVGSSYSAVLLLGWPGRLGGRLGLRRWAGRAGLEADSDYAAGLAGPAGRPTRTTPSTRAGWADSDYAVDRIGRLGLRRRYGTGMPRRTSWTCCVAREVLPCFQGHLSQPE